MGHRKRFNALRNCIKSATLFVLSIRGWALQIGTSARGIFRGLVSRKKKNNYFAWKVSVFATSRCARWDGAGNLTSFNRQGDRNQKVRRRTEHSASTPSSLQSFCPIFCER